MSVSDNLIKPELWTKKYLCSAVYLSSILVAGAALAEETESDKEKAKEVEEVVVTGSRIRTTKPTSHVEVMTSDDIQKLGLNSMEDILRSIPQNFNSVNSITTAMGQGNNGTPYGSAGTVAANLRGLGSANTLVLVNGRRMAGSATYEGNGTINLSTLPTEAIERVEIMLDGASAIYGSDALGGVINFITKKDYVGATTTVRYENSRHDADNYKLTQSFGFNWETGRANVVFTHDSGDSINIRDAGYPSMDFRSMGGEDRRRAPTYVSANDGMTYSRSGVYHNMGHLYRFYDPSQSYWDREIYGVYGSLPKGTTGNDWTLDDFTPEGVPYWDALQEQPTGSTSRKSYSVTISAEQELFEGVRLYTDTFYSRNTSEGDWGNLWVSDLTVPYTNPFAANILPGPRVDGEGNEILDPWSNVQARVSYHFRGAGLPSDIYKNEFERIQTTVGGKVDLPFKDWLLDVNYTFGQEEMTQTDLERDDVAFMSAVAGVQLEENPYWWLDLIVVLDDEGNMIPVPALNPFTGEHDPDLDMGSWFSFSSPELPKDSTHTFFMNAEGGVIDLPGGELRVSAGMEHRREIHDLTEDSFARAVNSLDDVSAKLERELLAVFFETSIPIIGADNAIPGVQELFVNLQGRWEEYSMEAQFDGPDSPETEKTFDQVSPRVAVLWKPVEDIKVRASWGESFKAPTILDLAEPPYDWGIREFEDPKFPDEPYDVQQYRAGNPNLKPETSENLSVGLEWSPEWMDGLRVKTTYTKLKWLDKISLVYFSDQRMLARMDDFPDVYDRGEDGRLKNLYRRPVNLAKSISEFVDLNLDYFWYTDLGEFSIGIDSTKALSRNESLFGETPAEYVNTEYGPDEWRTRVRVGWNTTDFGVNLTANYSSSYVNTFGLSDDPDVEYQDVDGYQTYDLTGWYNPTDDIKIKMGVRDLLNEEYPYFDSFRTPFDGSRVNTRGRAIYMSLSKDFNL